MGSKKKYPKRIWVEAERIEEDQNSLLFLTTAQIWGDYLPSQDTVQYRLYVPRKKKKVKRGK